MSSCNPIPQSQQPGIPLQQAGMPLQQAGMAPQQAGMAPQQPYAYAQAAALPPQPPVKKVRRWPLATIVGVVAFIIGIGVGGAGRTASTATPADPAQPNPTVTVTQPAKTVTVQPSGQSGKAAPTKPVAKPKAVATLVEGMNQIGVDAPAGRYKTIVPEDSANCYWERDKDDKGGFSSIIANENLDSGARGSVTVHKGEFFKSSGCGTWKRVQ